MSGDTGFRPYFTIIMEIQHGNNVYCSEWNDSTLVMVNVSFRKKKKLKAHKK